MHLVCSWEGGGRKGVIEVCAEMKKIHLYLRIPGLVRREGLVGLKPGPSLFLASIPIPAHPWVPDSLSHSAVMGRLASGKNLAQTLWQKGLMSLEKQSIE